MTENKFIEEIIKVKPDLSNFANKLTNNVENGRDLVQDTYVRALLYRNYFQDPTNIKAWLFTIMKHIFINGYRRKKKVKEFMSINTDLSPLHIAAGKEDNAEAIIALKDLWDIINNISPIYNETFKLYIAGYKYEEIAIRFNLPVGTIKSRIWHARKDIIKQIKENGINGILIS